MNVTVSLPQGFPQWKPRGGRWEEGNLIATKISS